MVVKYAYTHWSVRDGAEKFNYGSKIDHIIASGGCFNYVDINEDHNLIACHVHECDIMTEFRRWKPGMLLSCTVFLPWKGVLYCKPHFEQLFKESGNFNKNFQSPTRLADKSPDLKPELTRSPSKASRMFSGTQEKCLTCSKTVYPIEKVTVENQFYHKSCFKCIHGGCSITPSNYAALNGGFICAEWYA